MGRPLRILDPATLAARSPTGWPLHDSAATRRLESAAQAALPAHTLMRRAGLALARMALALAPHARGVLVVAGPGNNGGDGFEAAAWLHAAGIDARVLHAGDPARAPADALDAQARARAAGVPWLPGASEAEAMAPELVIDALLGVGAARAPDGAVADAMACISSIARRSAPPVLAVDLPSGLHPDTGARLGEQAVQASHTLALLSLKPGLFMAHGRDLAGEIWFDDLGVDVGLAPPVACLSNPPLPQQRRHAQHKGSFGDVLVVGGARGMVGAAWLAGRAALAAGAGRVFLGLLDPQASAFDAAMPELMSRPAPWRSTPLAADTVVCGCGGGDAVREALPALLAQARRLVIDADGLNALASDAMLRTLLARRSARGAPTLLTPHPLEAARLLDRADAASVQHDRLACVRTLVDRYGCGVVLKGSGSVIGAPGTLPRINPSGDARLASAGSGDVLAGWIAGRWASAPGGAALIDVASAAVYEHGAAVHGWPSSVLPAGQLVDRLGRLT